MLNIQNKYTISLIAAACGALTGMHAFHNTSTAHAQDEPTIWASPELESTQALFSSALKYPADCSASKMRKACSKNGCSVEEGGKHAKCTKAGATVTLIPHSVKSNNTCRSAIKKINSSC